MVGLVGEGTDEVRIPVGGDEVVRPGQRRRVDSPEVLASDQLADEVVHDVGDERRVIRASTSPLAP